MENNKYLEEFKIDLVKQYLQGKQKKTSAKNTGSQNRRCEDGYASMQETVKGLQEAINLFDYKPKAIQTDNGFEFSDRARVRGKGFFGTIKNEMFYNEGQANMTVKEFIPYLEKYLVWFREKRIKESLGYKSMIDKRKEDGVSW